MNDAYTLRIPSELKQKVSDSAKQFNRSMNADIVARLEQSFEFESSPISKDQENLIALLQSADKNIERSTKLIEVLIKRIEELENKKPTE